MPTLGNELLRQVDTRYGQELTRVATHLGASKDALLHLVLDPAFKPEGYAEFPAVLVGVLEKPLSEASCYPTAEALFPIIADDANVRRGGSEPKKSFSAAGPFQAAVADLVLAIDQAVQGGHDTVFRVEYGGHGFTLVARKPGAQDPVQVELIETIANGAMILPSLQRAPFAPGTVTTALTQMAHDDMATRKVGASAFGWDAKDFWLAEKDGEDPVFPNVAFRWWAGALRPDAVQRWIQPFASRLKALARAKQ